MRGINKVILIGNLGADPEIRYFQDGTAVCNFSMATSESWTDRQSGERKVKTEWHRVVAFRRLAEIIQQYLRKGSKLYVEGKLQTRSYEKDGQRHYVTEIQALNIEMLGGGADFSREPYGGGPAPQRSQVSQRDAGFDYRDNSRPGNDYGEFEDSFAKDLEASSSMQDEGEDDIPF